MKKIPSIMKTSVASLVTVASILPAFTGLSASSAYQSAVLADSPLAYYRLNDSLTRNNTNINSGSLGAPGNLTNTLNLHAIRGALAGSGDRAQFFHDGGSFGMIPFNAAFNPPNTQPFTIEAWFYPASDQINAGQCPINNRFAGGNRTGWVFFQRAPDLSYSGKPGFEGVGWNCRMYNGIGTGGKLDVVSQVPYEVGKWTHVVVVYDPVQMTNATLTMYIDGVAANTNIWTGGAGTDPGYAENAAINDVALSLGAYNNSSGAGNNAYFGGMDEFAFYASKLTPAVILSHYQNATNASRSTPYETLIAAANPVEYLRLNELPPGVDRAINMGDARAAGKGTHTAEARHPAPSALAGRSDDGAAAYHNRNGNSTTTIPYLAENNPNAGVPFTFETWLRPMRDQQGGQCPVNNRWVGGTGRTGWVIFQRDPNLSYPVTGSEGHGWNFRMYSGFGNSGQDVLTGTDYRIGEWQHLVFTWEPQIDNGDPGGNGNNQWSGILTAYVNGQPVASNTAALYAANRSTPETVAPAADLAIGSYNAASTLGNNPYEGDVDEVAFYNNYVLKPEQIAEHYAAGTNAHPATNYETLVLTAATEGSGNQRLAPKTYFRFNDAAYFPASNIGSLGYRADGSLILTTNIAAGPAPSAQNGFEAPNPALPLNGLKQWASLNNPAGLNFSGQITLETWIKPDAIQPSDPARIISHGPATLSNFEATDPVPDNAVTNSTETFLRLDVSTYVCGSAIKTNGATSFYYVSFPAPGGDLGGGNWIHLVGTYDGTNWRMYRNGVQVAIAAHPVGALPYEQCGLGDRLGR
jgi:hypothetical protein